MRILPGIHRGAVAVPRSKSHEHRLLIADFLAGDDARLVEVEDDAEDIVATKRCLRVLRTDDPSPLLDCGESAATRRFLGPVAAALGKRPIFKMAGRLASRPQLDYPELQPGEFRLAGDVSSQFVTGLLFALPRLDGDSYIRLESPLKSRGYVELTLKVLTGAGVFISIRDDGFGVPGAQTYQSQRELPVEGDWSAAAVWQAMNALGSEVLLEGLDRRSAQPDRVALEWLRRISTAWAGERVTIDVSDCPDLFPVLAVVAAGSAAATTLTGIGRLRLKESDRVAAMADVLARFGVSAEITDETFAVSGRRQSFAGGNFSSFADHRIAMAIAVGATRCDSPVEIDDASCVAKSYPRFFDDFRRTAADGVFWYNMP